MRLEQAEQSSIEKSDVKGVPTSVMAGTGEVVMIDSDVANGEEVGDPAVYRLGVEVGTIDLEGQGMHSLQSPHPRQIWPRPKSMEGVTFGNAHEKRRTSVSRRAFREDNSKSSDVTGVSYLPSTSIS